MSDNLVVDIKNAIKVLKTDIIEKQIQLDSLIEEYQKLLNNEFEN